MKKESTLLKNVLLYITISVCVAGIYGMILSLLLASWIGVGICGLVLLLSFEGAVLVETSSLRLVSATIATLACICLFGSVIGIILSANGRLYEVMYWCIASLVFFSLLLALSVKEYTSAPSD